MHKSEQLIRLFQQLSTATDYIVAPCSTPGIDSSFSSLPVGSLQPSSVAPVWHWPPPSDSSFPAFEWFSLLSHRSCSFNIGIRHWFVCSSLPAGALTTLSFVSFRHLYCTVTTLDGPENGATNAKRFQEEITSWKKRRTKVRKQITNARNVIDVVLSSRGSRGAKDWLNNSNSCTNSRGQQSV
jgi:hypothetical protein